MCCVHFCCGLIGVRGLKCYGQESFAQEAKLNRAYMGGVERGQRNVGVVNLHQIAEALDLSLSEFFAEMEDAKGRGDN